MLLFPPAVFAQRISFGVKGGVPLDRVGTEDSRTIADRERWIVGPTVEVALSPRLSLGADALYRRLGYTTTRNVGSATFFETATTRHWEVPLFLKYRFTEGKVRPFVSGGGAFEHASVRGSAGCRGDAMLCGGTPSGIIRSDSWGGGYLVGGGVEFRFGVVTFAPEFRYTRWQRGYFAGSGSNQPAVLLGVRLF